MNTGICCCFRLLSITVPRTHPHGTLARLDAASLTVIVHVLLHLVEHVDTLFVHDLIVGVVAHTVIVDTVVVIAAKWTQRERDTQFNYSNPDFRNKWH